MLQLLLEPLGKLKKTVTFFIYIYIYIYISYVQQKHKPDSTHDTLLPPRALHSLRSSSRTECSRLLKRTILIWTRYLVSSSDPLLKTTSFSFQLCSPPSKSYFHFKKSITTYRKCQGRVRIRGKDKLLYISLHSR